MSVTACRGGGNHEQVDLTRLEVLTQPKILVLPQIGVTFRFTAIGGFVFSLGNAPMLLIGGLLTFLSSVRCRKVYP